MSKSALSVAGPLQRDPRPWEIGPVPTCSPLPLHATRQHVRRFRHAPLPTHIMPLTAPHRHPTISMRHRGMCDRHEHRHADPTKIDILETQHPAAVRKKGKKSQGMSGRRKAPTSVRKREFSVSPMLKAFVCPRSSSNRYIIVITPSTDLAQ